MGGMEQTGMHLAVIEAIRLSAQRCGLRAVTLFGSRARGEQRPKSDIDLALSGGDQVRFALDVEENAPPCSHSTSWILTAPFSRNYARPLRGKGGSATKKYDNFASHLVALARAGESVSVAEARSAPFRTASALRGFSAGFGGRGVTELRFSCIVEEISIGGECEALWRSWSFAM